ASGTLSDDTNPKNYLQGEQIVSPSTRSAALQWTQCRAGANCSSTYDQWLNQGSFYKNGTPSVLSSKQLDKTTGTLKPPATAVTQLYAGVRQNYTDADGQGNRLNSVETAFVDPQTGVAYGVRVQALQGTTFSARDYYSYAGSPNGLFQSVSVSGQG